MHLPNGFLQKAKNTVHAIQAVTIFIAWAMVIAIFTKPGPTDSRIDYYFALCWFCVPALIYQTAVPIFTRTKRFANPYAFAAVDVLFTILWFAAFIGVAVWTNAGIHAGETKEKKPDGGCATFGYGTEEKCKLSQVTVGMGVMIFLLFIVTSAISAYSLVYHRTHGHPPNTIPTISHPTPLDDQTKYAFSSNPHDDLDDYEEQQAGLRPGRSEDDEYALLHTDTEEGRHPGRPLSWGQPRTPSPMDDTAYHGGRAYDEHRLGQSGDPFQEDLDLSHGQGPYNGGGGRVDFPEGDYHR